MGTTEEQISELKDQFIKENSKDRDEIENIKES